MIDICLVNWQTEYNYTELQQHFEQSAVYRNGILDHITHPLREPPTGLLILAAILEQQGYSVDVIDCMIYQDPHAFFREHAQNYRAFGFSSLTNTFPNTISILQYIYQMNPNAYYFVGGPHVSFTYEQELQNYPEIDAIFIGESEESFPWMIEFCLEQPFAEYIYAGITDEVENTFNSDKKIGIKIQRFLETGQNIPKGIAFRSWDNKNDSFIIKNSGFPDPTPLEQVPLPARHLINRIYQVADVIVNRGCPNQCSFCSRTKLFPVARIRPLEDVFEEVDYIRSCGNYQFINFYDNINVNHGYFNGFLDGLINRKLKLPWGAELRADVITEKEAQKLKQANCKLVATGIESAVPEVLKRNFKFQNPDKVARGIELLKKAGVGVQAYFIIGLPGDTTEYFKETLQFARNLPFNPKEDRVNFFVLTPYPGSDIAVHPEKYNISLLSQNYEDYNCHEILVETKELKSKQLQQMVSQAQALKQELGLK